MCVKLSVCESNAERERERRREGQKAEEKCTEFEVEANRQKEGGERSKKEKQTHTER
jgi:hypothetical protein